MAQFDKHSLGAEKLSPVLIRSADKHNLNMINFLDFITKGLFVRECKFFLA